MITTRLPENLSGYHIHMIGIKGTGMAALAELLVSRGAILTGSDVSDEFYRKHQSIYEIDKLL